MEAHLRISDTRASSAFRARASDDCEGILPSQFYEVSQRELTGEERLHAASIMQCVDDWQGLFSKSGRVPNQHRDEFSREDALTLYDFMFDDHYGDGDDCFISFRTICLALSIDINEFRAAMLKIGTKAQLLKLPLMTNAQLTESAEGVNVRRRAQFQRDASARRQAVFAQVRRTGCNYCAEPMARHHEATIYIHKAICQKRQRYIR